MLAWSGGRRLRGLGILLAAADAAALGLSTHEGRGKSADGVPAKPGPLRHSLAEAAKRLGVTVSWLRAESAVGRLPQRLIGSHWMFSEEDLEQIVKDAYRPSSSGTRCGRP